MFEGEKGTALNFKEPFNLQFLVNFINFLFYDVKLLFRIILG